MHYNSMVKANGIDMFIVRFLFRNGTEAESIRSYNDSSDLSLYHINFTIKSLDIAIAKIYTTSTGFTMYYYDNSRFLSKPWITRIEEHLPWNFTNEVRRMTYFSLRTESFLIFNYTQDPGTKVDIHFFVGLGEEDTAKIWFGSDFVFETEPYQCYGKFVGPYKKCCEKFKSFVVRNVDITGITPYYFKIEYRHKQNEPCLILTRKGRLIGDVDIMNDTWSITELKQSPFFIQPVINLELVDFQHTGKQVVSEKYV